MNDKGSSLDISVANQIENQANSQNVVYEIDGNIILKINQWDERGKESEMKVSGFCINDKYDTQNDVE